MKKYVQVLALLAFVFFMMPKGVSAQAAWGGIDMSGVTPAGSFDAPPDENYNLGQSLTVTGGYGNYWWAPKDMVYFAYLRVVGDCELIMHCSGLTYPAGVTGTPGACGAMIRAGITGNDANVCFNANSNSAAVCGEDNGAELWTGWGNGWFNNYWMRITRVGKVFALYHANQTTQPTTWTKTDTTWTLADMPDTAYAGFAITSGTTGQTATANVDYVSLTGNVVGAPPSAVKPSIASRPIAASAKIARTEYFSPNGQRLAMRNGKVIAANSVVIVHEIDVNGLVHVSTLVSK